MTDQEQTKRTIRAALAERGLNTNTLAHQLGIKQEALSRLLNHVPIVNQRSNWGAVLDALDLEVIVRPRSQ